MQLDGIISRVNELAAEQHGLVRVDQFGDSDADRLSYLARRGVMRRLTKGVYQVGGTPVTWHQRLQAGIWALGPTAAVSHRAAAQLHGFEGFDTDRVEFVVARGARNRMPVDIGAVVHSTVIDVRPELVHVAALPVTNPDRTIVDLARSGARKHRLEAAVDSALRLKLTTLDRIVARTAHFRGPARRGLARLDVVLVTSGGHSLLERMFLKLIRGSGLRVPEPQVVHRSEQRHVARVDFEFGRERVIVEVSGGRGHSSAADRAKDARRRNELQQDGWIVLEFTYEQVASDPEMVVATLKAALSPA